MTPPYPCWEHFLHDLKTLHTLTIRVIPNARSAQTPNKMSNGQWKIRIPAPAIEGKANAAFIKYIYCHTGIHITIVSGQKSRIKTIQVVEKKK